MADNPAVATPIYDEVVRELASSPETNGDDQTGTSVTETIAGPE